MRTRPRPPSSHHWILRRVSDQLFESDQGGAAAGQRRRRRSARGPDAAAEPLDDLVGQEHLLAAGSTLRTAIEAGEPHSMVLYGPPGTGKTTIARIVATRCRGRLRGGVGGERRASRGPGDARTGRGAPPRRPPDGVLPRRDPPLQQGSAGRAAARRRGRPRDADRRHDREPLLRGQLGAALPRPDLRAAALDEEAIAELLRRALSDRDRGIPDPPAVDDDALAMLAARAGGDARAALGALDRAATALGPGGSDRPRRRRGRAPEAGGPLRQGRRPPLRLHIGLDQGDPRTPTSTHRSTTSPRCSPAARIRASSPAGW